ncbi:serine/threonine-protein kinase bud32 [Puccinia graminis f. sp. tritici]|uniref:EKC/KEOPS complex subunit BUD32 n=2 Tax=Puccinia graminis f. sp. tritici TaxID=56615 RepID=A0A5B0MW12_PUCGR|nr:serine/threonine-protein kinase bud32 [Puccinia graminis f. sp. tritici]KAA1080396.1 serine/threonine-protein kinase bud32 [Puccinia graminis f. sp. tritici]KAA1120426.1 serine/threonine-protein kinase bud32 [Puccinia graminis f. sp. tritici]
MMLADFAKVLESSTLIKQGAEAKVYTVELVKAAEGRPGITVLLKYRFPKTYRHPSLDSQLTKNRLTFEARSLTRALKTGVRVPVLKGLDLEQGWLMLEWIEGISLREWLQEHQQHEQSQEELLNLLSDVGTQIAKLHSADIIHGDLTTSNMMLRASKSQGPSRSNQEVVMIDFGLSSVTSLVEDKAVDLYVLERAFLSTHSDPNNRSLKHSSPLFEIVLQAYANYLSQESWMAIKTRLANVRMRGRKRSMVG